MRADADKGVKVFASKKTIMPGDTSLLVISFIPEEKGRFNKAINLIASDNGKPYQIILSGNLQKIKSNDLTACYYFGKRLPALSKSKEQPMVVNTSTVSRDRSNKIPDPSTPKPVSPAIGPPPPTPTLVQQPVVKNEKELGNNYRPNNLLFLLDISGSMKDSLKLPLIKEALYTLIEAVRDIDSVTLITYSDSIRVLKEAVTGKNKKELIQIVSGLKARGLTRGRKAIHISQQVSQKHFISEGNNQIFIASDGKFKFEEEDYMKWKNNQGNKGIILTTIAFGDDREAIKNLKDIARKGNGSFIRINNRHDSREKLLNEVKERSKR
jgi:Mg-chelatase subunit ChlD